MKYQRVTFFGLVVYELKMQGNYEKLFFLSNPQLNTNSRRLLKLFFFTVAKSHLYRKGSAREVVSWM